MSKLFYALSWIASSAIEDLKESMRDTLTTDKPGWHMVLSFMQHVREPVIYVLAEFVRKGGGVPPFSAKEKNLLFFTLIFR